MEEYTAKNYTSKLKLSQRMAASHWHTVFNGKTGSTDFRNTSYEEELDAIRCLVMQFSQLSGKKAILQKLPKEAHGGEYFPLSKLCQEENGRFVVDLKEFTSWLTLEALRSFVKYMKMKTHEEVIDNLKRKPEELEASFQSIRMAASAYLSIIYTRRKRERLSNFKDYGYKPSMLINVIANDVPAFEFLTWDDMADYFGVDRQALDACLRLERPIGTDEMLRKLSMKITHMRMVQRNHDFVMHGCTYAENRIEQADLQIINDALKLYKNSTEDVTLEDIDRITANQHIWRA